MNVPIRFKLSLSGMFGDRYDIKDLDSLVNAPVYYNGNKVGVITDYNLKNDWIYGEFFDGLDHEFTDRSFSIELNGRNKVSAEIAQALKNNLDGSFK